MGTIYKNSGAEAATELGHKLVSGETKNARLKSWESYANQNDPCYVMCWRGGQRSRLAQQWLSEAGVSVDRIDGGYKTLRQTCMHVLEDAAVASKKWWVIAGRTGVQKTVAITNLGHSLDLEHHANHRGSSFGRRFDEQPTQASFENALAIDYLSKDHPQLVLEDESRTIGRVAVPESWHLRMKQSPLVQIEASLEERVHHIVEEYVQDPLTAGTDLNRLQIHFEAALGRIKNRLGGERFAHISNLVGAAFEGSASHESWVFSLLSDYYDPMYDYQLAGKEARIVMRGSRIEVEQYLNDQLNP